MVLKYTFVSLLSTSHGGFYFRVQCVSSNHNFDGNDETSTGMSQIILACKIFLAQYIPFRMADENQPGWARELTAMQQSSQKLAQLILCSQ